jgi:hypothetical protein
MELYRRVFFIAGFDPKSPRYYHQLYRALARHRAPGAEGHGGPPPAIGARRALNDWADEWDVTWARPDGGPPLVTRYTLLRWDDIVRAHWALGSGTVWHDYWRFYVDGWRQGFFRRTWKGSRRNWMFVMFPLALLFAWMLLWATLAVGLIRVSPAGWPWAASWVGAAALAAGSLWGWRRVSHRLGADWLMRLYGFSHAQAAGEIDGLDQRIDAMAGLIREAEAAETPARELLVVGHSAGATLAASALSRALSRQRSPAPGPVPELALLTLGHCIPLAYFFATARGLRDELDSLVAHARLTWVDYTAPADWAGCAEIPPWPRPGPARLARLSPRFPRIVEEQRYRRLRQNRLEMHMHYLKPPDRAGRYDLLAFTAGAPTLRERHPDAIAGSP